MNSYTPEEILLLQDMVEPNNHDESKPYTPTLLRSAFRSLPIVSHIDLYRGITHLCEGYTPSAAYVLKMAIFEETLQEMPVRLYEEGLGSVRLVAKWRLTIGR